jgi:hypothetical protein
MPAEKQQQFRAGIKANRKPWNSKVELTMPGELKLYRDYELTDESEHASAAGKKGGKKGGATDAKPETKERLNYTPSTPTTRMASTPSGSITQGLLLLQHGPAIIDDRTASPAKWSRENALVTSAISASSRPSTCSSSRQ